jgi:hypothetical protein
VLINQPEDPGSHTAELEFCFANSAPASSGGLSFELDRFATFCVLTDSSVYASELYQRFIDDNLRLLSLKSTQGQ